MAYTAASARRIPVYAGVVIRDHALEFGYSADGKTWHQETEARLSGGEKGPGRLAALARQAAEMIREDLGGYPDMLIVTKPGMTFLDRCCLSAALEQRGVRGYRIVQAASLAAVCVTCDHGINEPRAEDGTEYMSLLVCKSGSTYDLCFFRSSDGVVEIVDEAKTETDGGPAETDRVQDAVAKLIDHCKARYVSALYFQGNVPWELCRRLEGLFRVPCVAFGKDAVLRGAVLWAEVFTGKKDLLLLDTLGFTLKAGQETVIGNNCTIPCLQSAEFPFSPARADRCTDLYFESGTGEIVHIKADLSAIAGRPAMTAFRLTAAVKADTALTLTFTAQGTSRETQLAWNAIREMALASPVLRV